MDPWLETARSLGVPRIRSEGGSRLKFSVQGRPALLEDVWVDDIRALRLTVDLRGVSPGSLKIFPEGLFTPIARLFGAQDLSVGDRAFDAMYVVKASPAGLAATMFSGPRRARLIEAVRAVGRYLHPLFDLSRDTLRIHVSQASESRALLERMIAAGQELTSAALGAKMGSALLWEEPTSTPRNARCPVCGSPLQSAVTHCRRCRTPHHHECWQYFGGCATYACEPRALRK